MRFGAIFVLEIGYFCFFHMQVMRRAQCKKDLLHMEAVIKLGGRQYRVSEGKLIRTEMIKGVNDGDEIVVKDVLAILDGNEMICGKPYVEGVSVILKKLRNEKGKKVMVFKFKRKKRYRRKYGYRQIFSILRVEKIENKAKST